MCKIVPFLVYIDNSNVKVLWVIHLVTQTNFDIV